MVDDTQSMIFYVYRSGVIPTPKKRKDKEEPSSSSYRQPRSKVDRKDLARRNPARSAKEAVKYHDDEQITCSDEYSLDKDDDTNGK